MSELYPVEGWPGYTVNRLGQVFSEFGSLCHDSMGKVCLRHKDTRKKRRFFIGDVMEMAGLLVSVGPGQSYEEEVATLRHECDALRQVEAELRDRLVKAEQTIARGRKLNGHLLYLVRNGQQEADPQEKPQRRKRHKARDFEPDMLDMPETLDFNEWDS